jgi:ATP-dependent metalloprotease
LTPVNVLDVDVSVIARGCPGFSGAELANLINQAAIKASRDGAKEITMKHLEWAKDKIIMGQIFVTTIFVVFL